MVIATDDFDANDIWEGTLGQCADMEYDSPEMVARYAVENTLAYVVQWLSGQDGSLADTLQSIAEFC